MSDKNKWDSYFDREELAKGNQVMANKLGIKDADRLDVWERRFTADRLQELESNPIRGNLDFEHLKKIHGHVFQDVYSWAGEPRIVNISKGSSSFEHHAYLEHDFGELHKSLQKNNFLQGKEKPAFVDALTDTFTEANRLHPFREGNGRATRVWAGQLAERAGYGLDQRHIDQNKDRWNQANAQAMAGNKTQLKAFFNEALRPSRSLAFEQLPKEQALGKFPELKSAFDALENSRARIAASYPNNPRAQATFDVQARSEVVRALDTGRVNFGAAKEASVERDYGNIVSAGDTDFSKNLRHLVEDKRFKDHTPKELASAAYWRGVYKQSSEGIGQPFEGEHFDKLMSDRKNASRLMEPPEIQKMEREATKLIGKNRDDGLSL